MQLQRIGTRLKALRDDRKLSQVELAQIIGFKDRQTISAIETGVRRMNADELLRVVDALDVSLDYFSDPFLLVGEGRFSWRHQNVSLSRLIEYERNAERWIGMFRSMAFENTDQIPLMRSVLNLTNRSSLEDAVSAGERFVAQFDLGEVPAIRLANVLEQELNLLVLMIDAPNGISGASCRLPEFDSVLIARKEAKERRIFNLALELFHLLTWDAIPPNHWEEDSEFSTNREKQLAINFSSALLMPSRALQRYGDWESLSFDKLIDRLNAVAVELQVTSSALKWRLAAMGKVKRTTARSLSEHALHNNVITHEDDTVPPLFSRPFVEVLGKAIKDGRISIRRSAKLLGLEIEELSSLFVEHGVEDPVNM